MALDLKISHKLGQSLVMTQQVQQSIKLLQLGRQEYLDVIENELLENPFLEDSASNCSEEYNVDNEDYTELNHEDLQTKNSAVSEVIEILNGTSSNLEFSSLDNAKILNDSEFDWNDYFSTQKEWSQFEKVRKSNSYEISEFNPIDSVTTELKNLEEHLLLQLQLMKLNQQDLQIAKEIIGNLDTNGYLACSLEEIANFCSVEPQLVEKVLKIIQELEPAGIGARNLKECLSVQLKMKGLQNTLPYQIIQKHLEKLESKKYDLIAKEEACLLDEVYQAVKLVQSLVPRPGDIFNTVIADYIVPDVYVRKLDNEYIVSINDDGIPKLQLNPYYRSLLNNLRKTRYRANTVGANEKEFFQNKSHSAMWLIKSIQQRQTTIQRVTESIMKFQREFLEHGISALKPLVLKDIAEDVNLHESTISRVTANKYVHTPQGIFELKFFFSSGFKNNLAEQSSEISAEVVKNKIKQIVASEDPKKPFSDQVIVETLKSEGINIARRTVAKYREMQNILSSSRRKRVI